MKHIYRKSKMNLVRYNYIFFKHMCVTITIKGKGTIQLKGGIKIIEGGGI